MTAILITILNRAALAAPEISVGVAVVVIAIAPRLRVLRYPNLVVPRRKAGSR